MADQETTSDPVGPGWWKTKAGWKYWSSAPPGVASPWPNLVIGIVLAIGALLIGGWEAWPLAGLMVLMGSAGFVTRRARWWLAGLLITSTIAYWILTSD